MIIDEETISKNINELHKLSLKLRDKGLHDESLVAFSACDVLGEMFELYNAQKKIISNFYKKEEV